jgi:hypothetical protein
MIILKGNLHKTECGDEFIWLTIGSSGGLFEHGNEP